MLVVDAWLGRTCTLMKTNFLDVIEVGKFQVQECKFPVNLKSRLPLQKTTGFTLIEIVVVLVIVGIIAGVTIPRFAGSFETIKFRRAMSDIVSFLRESRIASMSTGKAKTVTIDLKKDFAGTMTKNTHTPSTNGNVYR